MDQVIAARPDAVIVAGDIFHSVRPTNPAILFAFHQLQRLRDALPEAPLIVIAGNHDTPRSTETGSILELFETLGVEVVSGAPRRLAYPALGLSVLAVPHSALVSTERPELRPGGSEPHQVLVLHGEVEGIFPADRTAVEYGGAVLSREELVGALRQMRERLVPGGVLILHNLTYDLRWKKKPRFFSANGSADTLVWRFADYGPEFITFPTALFERKIRSCCGNGI